MLNINRLNLLTAFRLFLLNSLVWVWVEGYLSASTTRRIRNQSTTIQLHSTNSPTHLVFPGGGIYFYWQAGFVSYLREAGYDPSACSATGASAGALAATLTTTGVDFYEATDLALRLAKDAGVWDRKNGLQGIWGPMIHHWLDELLPDDAIETLCRSNDPERQESSLTLLLTPARNLFGPKRRVSCFTSKEDLIQCNMASVHLPWFLNGKLTRKFRNRRHIDGSFLSKSSDYRSHQEDVREIIVHHSLDPKYQKRRMFDFVDALSPSGIYDMLEDGKSYAKSLLEAGLLDGIPKRCDTR
ncbi:hypothetical protein FisN_6Lh243 [Fistulifera solaris]|uniref:PNPLA domain-containing protein n=1 Tax=Fistulifera solaris TaxID=1519565 RepID=A0A1Z5J5X1_FISSO|nr:hypothetical protein FisN_6Lh243 [Fistulifera solaris]|eukprot:GAX09383.1 hypothetical protein FisN_6Lh243 [Fistulifera solaris]